MKKYEFTGEAQVCDNTQIHGEEKICGNKKLSRKCFRVLKEELDNE